MAQADKDRHGGARISVILALSVAFALLVALLSVMTARQAGRACDSLNQTAAAFAAGTGGDAEALQAALRAETERVARLQTRQAVLSGLVALSVALLAAVTLRLVLFPLRTFITRVTAYEPLPMTGAHELRYLARAYNGMYEENQRKSAHLRHEAEHDPLTGLYNRGAFDKLRREYAGQRLTMMLIDVDYFKSVNDTYGHQTGDRVLQKVAALLSHSFRAATNDFPCRTGGDEFAVIMTDTSSVHREVVQRKIELVREGLADVSDGLPPVTLSIGVAFSDREGGTGDVYKDADIALYQTKGHGRNGCTFYGDIQSK